MINLKLPLFSWQFQVGGGLMVYRILSLDGGGAWSLIQVNALIALYDKATPGHTVLADFDLVAASSGGSLVLGGLVENLKLGDLLGYFEDEKNRKSVFSPTTSVGDWTLQKLTGLGPRYSAEAKLPGLQRLLPKRGNVALPDAASGVRRAGASLDVHLLIIGFDYDRNRATFFRSAPAGTDAAWGKGDISTITLAEAIHASTNAPVNYFDAPAAFPDRPERYWDGGITGCNNPILAAVTEAIVLGQKRTDIVALSIGTASVALPWPAPGQAPSPLLQPRTDQSLITDLRKLATSILDDPPDIATFLAHVMTGGGDGVPPPADSRIVRMNPLICPVKGPGDNWVVPGGMTLAQFSYLAKLELDAVEQAQVDAITAYTEQWLLSKVSNQPIRMNGDTLKLEVGSNWFQEAVAAWNKIKVGLPKTRKGTAVS